MSLSTLAAGSWAVALAFVSVLRARTHRRRQEFAALMFKRAEEHCLAVSRLWDAGLTRSAYAELNDTDVMVIIARLLSDDDPCDWPQPDNCHRPTKDWTPPHGIDRPPHPSLGDE